MFDESKSIAMLNYIIKAAFKTKITCYHPVHHVFGMFSRYYKNVVLVILYHFVGKEEYLSEEINKK